MKNEPIHIWIASSDTTLEICPCGIGSWTFWILLEIKKNGRPKIIHTFKSVDLAFNYVSREFSTILTR